MRWTANSWAVALTALSMAAIGSHANAADPAIEKVLSDWKERLNKVKTVRYELSGTQESPLVNPKRPFAKNYIIIIDFENKRIRIEETGQTFVPANAAANNAKKEESGKLEKHDVLVETYGVRAYDGKVLYQWTPSDRNTYLGKRNPNFFITRGNLATLDYPHELWPVFEAHGIIPTTGKVLRPDRLPSDHVAEDLHIRGKVNHIGRTCLILGNIPPNEHIPLSDELYIDGERGSAVVRHVYFGSNKPLIRSDVIHESTDIGWMPASWKRVTFSPQNDTMMDIVAMKVTRLDLNCPVNDEMFTLKPRPGEIVMEYEYPEAGRGLDLYKPATKTYTATATGLPTITKEIGFTTGEGVPLPPERTNWYWWVIPSCVFAIAFVGFVFYRRRKTNSKP